MKYNGHGMDLEELKHSNYVLQSLPKGLKFLRVVVCQGIPKSHGSKGDS